MEKEIYELSERFYNIVNKTSDLNGIILLTAYKSITDFFDLHKNKEYNITIKELLKKCEKDAYMSKGKYLTDKQIIRYELKRIKVEYQKQKNKCLKSTIDNQDDLDENLNVETNRHLLVLAEHHMDQLKIFNEVDKLTPENILTIKNKIAYIEILLKMKNGLYYETFLCFKEELDRIEKLENNQKYYKKI